MSLAAERPRQTSRTTRYEFEDLGVNNRALLSTGKRSGRLANALIDERLLPP
jgi:hypothetical protein